MSWILPAFLTFVGIAVLVVLHEAGHFAAAKAVGMRVEKFSLFFGPMVWSRRRGETVYGIGTIPLGGFVKITGMNPTETLEPDVAPRAFYRQPVWKRIFVIGAGPFVNFVLAFVILWGYFSATPVRTDPPRTEPVVAAIAPDSPGVGVLQEGDRILAVDGKRGSPDELRKQLATHKCAGEQRQGCRAAVPARLTIERDGRIIEVTVTPEYDAEARRPLIGFGFREAERELGFWQAAPYSVTTMWDVTSATVETVVGLFYSSEKRDQVGSIVGGYEATRRQLEYDAGRAVATLGLISLSLAVINLFPFLPLDGGHIFWALAEKVRRRPISFRTMERASVLGFALIMVLFFIGFTNDVERLQDGTFDRIR